MLLHVTAGYESPLTRYLAQALHTNFDLVSLLEVPKFHLARR